MRFFTTEGPVNCAKHYCLPPLARLDLDDIRSLIAQEKYFLLHAPRQTGKTTCLLALAELLNREGTYTCVYANIEPAQAMREDVGQAMAVIVSEIGRWAEYLTGDARIPHLARQVLAESAAGSALGEFLNRLCRLIDKPLVLLLDEVDALIGDSLIAVLRQLRAGYPTRPRAFPQTVVLCGVRDLQDYRIHASSEKTVVTGGSAFNIKAQSLRLGDFIRDEVETLLSEHTNDTGQIFTADARELTWQLTQGQPWLVNALAHETTWEMRGNRERTRPIDAAEIRRAKEQLVLRRVTHLDQLADKLREPRVRRVIEPMLRGESIDLTINRDDVDYALDLGLIRRGADGPQIANPIYREVIPRELTAIAQMNLEAQQKTVWYVRPDGTLDLAKLLAAFQQFFREHSESWLERFDYREAGPQLLLQAFLQRIVNGGGRVDREYGLGRRRTDLAVFWNHPGGVQRAVIELKLRYTSTEQTIADGLAQTADYADRIGSDEAHLLIFDRRADVAWDDKIWQRDEPFGPRTIHVWGV